MDENRADENDLNGYDVIIIGAGIGGLSCASMLALEDKKVLVLEKNPFIGGRCSSYKREGYTIDYAIHIFTLGSNGPLQIPIDKAQHLFEEPLLKWQYVNPTIKYKKDFIRTYLPLNFSHFWNYIRTGFSLLKINQKLRRKKEFINLIMDIKGKKQKLSDSIKHLSVEKFLNLYSESDFIHSIGAILSNSYAVYKYEYVSALDFIEVYNRMFNGIGGGYPIGGSVSIPNAYRKIIELKGGKVLTSNEVRSVIIGNSNEVLGVKMEKEGKEIFSKCVVSNINWKHFIEHIVEKSYFSEELIDKIENSESSYSSLVLHIGLKKKIINEKFLMIASSLKPEIVHDRIANGEFVKERGFFVPIVSNIDPSLAPKGKQLILACTGGTENYMGKYKKELIETMLDNLDEITIKGENLRDNIDWMEILEPSTIDKLWGERGAVLGLAQIQGQVRNNRLPNNTPIRGLYHCGDDSGIGLIGVGTELASLSGQKCAELILKDGILSK